MKTAIQRDVSDHRQGMFLVPRFLGTWIAVLSALLMNPQISPGQVLEGQVENVHIQAHADATTGTSEFHIHGAIKPHVDTPDEPLKYLVELDGELVSGATSLVESWEIRLVRLKGKWNELNIHVPGISGTPVISIEPVGQFRYSLQALPGGKDHELKIVPIGEGQESDQILIQFQSRYQQKAPLTDFAPTPFEFPMVDAVVGKLNVQADGPFHLTQLFQGSALFHSSEQVTDQNTHVQQFQFEIRGADYKAIFRLNPNEPDLFANSFNEFELEASLDRDAKLVRMVLSGVADIKNTGGGRIALVGGDIGVVAYSLSETSARLIFESGTYYVESDKPARIETTVRFHCRVQDSIQNHAVNVYVADSPLRPISLHGWDKDSSFEIQPMGDVHWESDSALGFLKPTGGFSLSWKSKSPEVSTKEFYSVQSTSQMALGSGRLSQSIWLDYQVMQGELNRLELTVQGEGEILRVEGEDILSWKILPGESDDLRRIEIESRRPIKGLYQVRLYTQQILPAFPSTIQPLRVIPIGALAFGGHVRVTNEGAVKLEIRNPSNLTQISPERFPRLSGFPEASGNQVFAYRFSGAESVFQIAADTILPEVSMSQIAIHQLGRNAQSIQIMIELDIREAPLREFEVILPVEYVLTRVEGNQIADYFFNPGADNQSVLKLIFSQPVSGRWAGQIELNRNQPLVPGVWAVPSISNQAVKTSRGHIGIVAEQGLRVTTSQLTGLAEVASAFFPKKVDGLTLAYRLRDPQWELRLNIDELDQSIQVDTLQLFSLGEGMAYGSSLLNYLVSGSPLSSFEVTASDAYSNVEFVGKGIRNWKRTPTGYQVFLENPIFGTYSLLATYDMKLSDTATTYPFEGIHPVTAKNNQGYVLFISHYQVELGAPDLAAASNIVAIEPAEIPSEYRLLFDSPLVDSYQYSSWPFDLDLGVKELERGNSLQILTDRVEVVSEVSADGQTVHASEYFIKNKGNSHIRYRLPEGVQLWEVRVDGEVVVPVSDNGAVLVPLTVKSNPNELIQVSLRTAVKPANPRRFSLQLPILETSTLVTQWTVRSVDGKRLVLKGSQSSLEPVRASEPERGYAGFKRLLWERASNRQLSGLSLGLLVTSLLFLGAFSRLKRIVRLWAYVPVKWISLSGITLSILAAGILTISLVRQSFPSDQMTQDLEFIVPVQNSGSSLAIDIAIRDSQFSGVSCPAILSMVLGLICLGISAKVKNIWPKNLLRALGWGFILGGCLVQYLGVPWFTLGVMVLMILDIWIPVCRLSDAVHGGQSPSGADPISPDSPSAPSPGEPGSGLAGVTPLVIAFLMFGMTPAGNVSGQAQQMGLDQSYSQASEPAQQNQARQMLPPLHIQDVERLTQKISIQGEFALTDMEIGWNAQAGATLMILGSEAVLESIHFHARPGIRLLESQGQLRDGTTVFAETSGLYKISLRARLPLHRTESRIDLPLPNPKAISHILTIDFGSEDMEILRDNVISVERDSNAGAAHIYRLVMSPVHRAVLSWQPRSRDARTEKSVYFAEVTNIFVPSAGVIDGLHTALIRPAQGQLDRLEMEVHPSLTIVDVPDKKVRSWRFDPDAGRFYAELKQPSSQPFEISFMSQSSSGALPYQKDIGLVHVIGAARELGYVAVAAPGDIQLDQVDPLAMATLSLEDFNPRDLPVSSLEATIRRAYQYSGTGGGLRISASEVSPDIRVETRQTLSLGEDRTLLATTASLTITRSGIFRIQFALPDGLEVESLTGALISHWTQSPADGQNLVTIHLKSRTVGSTQFQINLVGMGMLGNPDLIVPRIQFLEATKQTGILVVAPEQGVRLYPENLNGVVQTDALAAGVRQKGALVFNLLQKEWGLAFSIEKVNAWLQGDMLQKVSFREGLAKTDAEFVLSIENSGVDTLSLEIPSSAESVEITGSQVVDFIRSGETNDVSRWEIRFERRIIGVVPIKIRFQQPISPQLTQWPLSIIRSPQVNLYKSWVAFRSEGRLRVEMSVENNGFQPTDWAAVPSPLRGATSSQEGFARLFRQVNNSDSLALQIVRNDVQKVLPARILSTRLTSIVSSGGDMLTMVELTMDPGEERQMVMKLPAGSEFWLGYINEKSIWPWKAGDNLLLPIEKNPANEMHSVFKFIYYNQFARTEIRDGQFPLVGPAFDLPLEDISWKIFMPDGVLITKVKGNMDLVEEVVTPVTSSLSRTIKVQVDDYISQNSVMIENQNNTAVEYLNLGNQYMMSGDNINAQRAFENAINFSQSDPTFNEDARVQFQNIRSQQANIALNARINNVFNKKQARETPSDYGNLTQAEIDELLVSTSEEDREAMQRLANRLVRQQEAAVARPASIYASFPEGKSSWTLERSHLVDRLVPLNVSLSLDKQSAGFSWKEMMRVITLSVLVLLVFFALLPLVLHSAGRK